MASVQQGTYDPESADVRMDTSVKAAEPLCLKKVQDCLDSVLYIVQSYLPFSNAHSNDLIIHGHWERYVPAAIRDDLMGMSDQQLCDIPARYIDTLDKLMGEKDDCQSDHYSDAPVTRADGTQPWIHTDLDSYIRGLGRTNLQCLGLLVNIEDLFSKTGPDQDELQIQNFMTSKKSHEVDVMTYVCSRLAKSLGADVIVDIGSGKGYLSTQLALKYHMTVVGIDAQMINTKGAVKRARILKKQWQGLVRNAQEFQDTGTVTKKSKKLKKKLKKERMSSMIEEVEEGSSSLVTETRDESPQEEYDGLGRMFGGEEDAGLVGNNTGLSLSVQNGCVTSNLNDTSTDVPSRSIQSNIITDNNIQNQDQMAVDFEIENFSNMTLDEAKYQVSSTMGDTTLCSNVNLGCVPKTEPETLHNINVGTRAKTTQRRTESDRTKLREITSYIPVTLFVDTSMNLMDVVSKALREYPSSSAPCDLQRESTLMLTGLHTCGALASSMLELFVNNPTVTVLCGVGCCYHYMGEAFCPPEEVEEDLPVGFPMSDYLKNQKVFIGRKARNFASQSVYRQAQEQELSLATYPRCLLQKILLDIVGYIDPDWKGLRGRGSSTTDMYQYVMSAFTTLGLPTDKITPELVGEYCHKYEDDKRKLAAFRQLKSVLAPTIESLVLLDRACYLLEQACVGQVYLVQMFDPVISPRCYGIVAMKNPDT